MSQYYCMDALIGIAKHLEKKLGENYTRTLQPALNKSWKQHPTKQQLYSHLLFVIQTIQVKRARHSGHCWRSKDKLISNILLWTSIHGHTCASRHQKNLHQPAFTVTGFRLEDLPKAIANRIVVDDDDDDVTL